MNWFLFRVTESFTDDDGIYHEAGSKGAGQCSMEPGIMEAPRGVMYVVPGEYINDYHINRGQRRYCASLMAEAVSKYFGVIL